MLRLNLNQRPSTSMNKLELVAVDELTVQKNGLDFRETHISTFYIYLISFCCIKENLSPTKIPIKNFSIKEKKIIIL